MRRWLATPAPVSCAMANWWPPAPNRNTAHCRCEAGEIMRHEAFAAVRRGPEPATELKQQPDSARLQHVIESQQFTVPMLMELFDRSRGMERVVARGGTLDYQNKILATLFYEPSTRTRFSFEAAMHRLGGRVLSTENARSFSSEVEGEQVEDSIRIIGGYSRSE